MTTRLHINISQGLFEVEGEEPFVREMYEDFKAELAQKPIHSAGSGGKAKSPKKKAAAPAASKGGAAKKKGGSPKVDKSLDLSGGNGSEPLKEFSAKYQPAIFMDRNVVYVAYLKDLLNMETVTIDHVWTCYHHMKDSNNKLTSNLSQSLRDTGSEKGDSRLNAGSLQDLSVSVPGDNWLTKQADKVKNNPS